MKQTVQKKVKSIAWQIIQTKLFKGLRPEICRSPVFQLEGKAKRSDCRFSSLVFASKELANYFSMISYADQSEPKYVGKTILNDIPSVIADLKPDVALVCTSVLFSDFLLSKNFVVLPYIRFSLDISDCWDSIWSRMHRSKQRMIRRIKGLNYSYEISKDQKKLEQLYREMYVPHVSEKHGKSAEIVSFAEVEKLFRKGGLLFVKRDGKPVSGAVYVPQGNELYVPLLNTNQNDKHLEQDANCAALYFLILWAKENGYSSIDYGSCKPFLNDGAFRYKKEWGMKANPIEEKDAKIMAIQFCNFSESTRDFVLSNPFVFSVAGKLRGLVALNSVEDLLNSYYVSGLSSLVALCVTQDSQRLKQRYRLASGIDIGQSILPSPLLKMMAEEGYEAHDLKFPLDN
jgi:hypothetical protein